MKSRLIHNIGDSVEFLHGDRQLFRYVYEPQEDIYESPKPYFHPVRTLAGNEVTIYRPHDHLWHKGIQMTLTDVGGHNFWGGPTYVHGQGYVRLENHGRMKHRTWDEMRCDDENGVVLQHQLDWITLKGEAIIAETRRVEVPRIADDHWSMRVAFSLNNVSGQRMKIGSPTTKGRPLAGYGSLFWRGPRSFNEGQILAGDGLEGPDVMGKSAPWLAYIGAHDGNCENSTLVFFDDPRNPRYPTKWFVRNKEYGCASCSFMFDEEYALEAGATLTLHYHVVIANGAWTRERIEHYRGTGFQPVQATR